MIILVMLLLRPMENDSSSGLVFGVWDRSAELCYSAQLTTFIPGTWEPGGGGAGGPVPPLEFGFYIVKIF